MIAGACVLAGGASVLFASGVRAQTSQDVPPPPLESPTPVVKTSTEHVYPIGEIQLEYAYTVADVPDLASIAQLSVPLVREPEGFRAPAKDETKTELVSLNRPAGTPPAPFTASAVRAIDQAVADDFGRQGIVGVIVRPHPDDIGASTGRDLRPPGQTRLRLVVLVNRVAEMHTIASGYRVAEDQRVDNPKHGRILENSPVEVGERVNREELDDYVDFLNRHPARWVDMALGASGEPAGARLEYLVAEARPWTAYFQTSNTGTDETTDWRQRFGFTHNQVTNRDDILQLDYITGDFDSVNAFFGSYDSPIPFPWLLRPDRVRASVDGQWSEYDASDVGIENSEFQGSQWIAGGRVKANVFQWDDFFVDLFTGAHFEHYDADSRPVEGTREHGNVNFFFPEIGAVLERRTEISQIHGMVSGQFNIADLAGTDSDDLRQMGRTGVHEENVNLLRWDAMASFFMVPFFFPSKEPDTSLSASDLSNEVFLSFRGQYTDARLIPAMQDIAGGLETVRGWPQSFIAADTLYLVRAEYRLHLPRLLPIREPFELPWYGKFRAAPDGPSGRPDWDFIVYPFYDWARVEVNGTLSQDEDEQETLSGTGLGFELQLPGSLIVGLDYGWNLTQVMQRDKFSDKLYVSIALVY